jgi:hypothetical protein
MRITAIAGTIGAMFVRAYLGSVVGYTAYWMHQLISSHLWSWKALVVAPLWGLMMGCVSFPVAQLSVWIARMAESGRGVLRIPLVLVGLSLALASGSYIFIWYMTALIPIVNWQKSWLWPVAASLCAFLIEYYWHQRSVRRAVA